MTPPTPPPLPDDVDAVRRRLRLPYLRRHAPEVLATAKAQRWDPTEVLRVLLVEEATGRDTATRAQRRKAAGFPSGKTLDAWDTRASSIPLQPRPRWPHSSGVARAENLAICGPSVDLAAAELTLEEFEKLL